MGWKHEVDRLARLAEKNHASHHTRQSLAAPPLSPHIKNLTEHISRPDHHVLGPANLLRHGSHGSHDSVR